jgi:hypothetical protein
MIENKALAGSNADAARAIRRPVSVPRVYPPALRTDLNRFIIRRMRVHRDMSKLTERTRAKLPARMFGLPEKARTADAKKETGNYPIPDRGHAISAKRLSRKQRKAGNLTKDEFERINRKADKMLRKKPGS